LQMTAQEFKQLKDSGSSDHLRDFITQLSFNQSTLVIKGQMNNYQGQITDENRIRYNGVRIIPYNVKEENQMLLRRLKMYSE
jgi:hypothetical protein